MNVEPAIRTDVLAEFIKCQLSIKKKYQKKIETEKISEFIDQ